jgi:hypothetical protein
MKKPYPLGLPALIVLFMVLIFVVAFTYKLELENLFTPLDPVNYLPENSEDWACVKSEIPKLEMEAWCAANPFRGTPINEHIFSGSTKPVSLMNLPEKNEYDKRLADFMLQGKFKTLNWLHDKSWRLTGPYVGEPGSGASYGVHPAVKIYYSPEVVDWLCDGKKEGGIPDGAMIIKAMLPINEKLDINLDQNSCMTIEADQNVLDDSPSEWTVMVKDKNGSHDGWYWADAFDGPPITDKSAFQSKSEILENPIARNENIYPTGNLTVTSNNQFIPSEVYPYSDFGVACLNCHGSAKTESTFVDLENLMGAGIQYKGYAFNKTFVTHGSYPAAFPTPYYNVQSDFSEYFSMRSDLSFSDAWALRFPAQTYSHTVAIDTKEKQFLTSDQCIGCHDATQSNSGKPNMVFTNEDNEWVNLSMFSEWSVSPMGLAGRDPIFFSQLQSETNYFPDLKDCIENTCLHCHGVLGQREFSRQTEASNDAALCAATLFPDDSSLHPPEGVPMGELFTIEKMREWQNKGGHEGNYGGLARDGISCMACHQMEKDPTLVDGTAPDYWGTDILSENQPYYTGNFLTTDKAEIFGPLKNEDIIVKPMEHVLGLTPKYNSQISKSEMCGNCHNILLPTIKNDGSILGASYEQSTHLEWANSDFAKPDNKNFQSCQDCHMPHTYDNEDLKFKIANIESSDFAPTTGRLEDKDISLTEVLQYPRHSLHGLNVFLNQMFQQFPAILGFRQIDYMNAATIPALTTGQNSMLEMARTETANVNVQHVSVSDNTLEATILVTNKVGHYLPSGAGFRRMFLEFLILDGNDETLWASGRTNKVGFILDGITDRVLETELPVKNPKLWQPHYETVHKSSEVQIYQEVILDSDDNISTSFLRRIEHVKDNRIRPKGFSPEFFKQQSSKYIKELAELHGDAVKLDPYYFDPKLTGADSIRYSIDLGAVDIKKAKTIRVTLFSQSIPPGYLQQRFDDADHGTNPESSEIDRLFYLTSHLNVKSPKDKNGKPFMKDWKLKVGESAEAQIKMGK